MKLKYFGGLLIAMMIAVLTFGNGVAADELQTKLPEAAKKIEKDAHVKGEVIVKFKKGTSGKSQNHALKGLNAKAKPDLDTVKSPFKVLEVGNVKKVVRALNKNPNVAYAEPNYKMTVTWSPNDTYATPGYQYGLFTTYTDSAWNIARGDSSQEIAVLDTGVDYTHEDLDNKTILGYDFVQNDYRPMDQNGHGTHVAGIAAAETNNSTGIAGMAPNTSILAVRVLDAQGSGSLADIADGIRYAANQNAEVINLSLGCNCDTQTLENAVNYAWNQGSVIIAAAGNDGVSTTFEPASYENVLAVGAVNSNNQIASFSNYGPWVDVMAPGVDIASTYPNNRYVYMSGTSMASPSVAGLAGLLAGQGRNNVEIRQAIENTAYSIGSAGYYYEDGMIDSYSAVNY
ncbi:S8 family peptidase [Virgibacillus ihumii]|uniref:S8 family peptidase n=1 Tax=Virgibacillus ihumii TaxID=2686091 RepID=UPI00157C0F2F|nr:S8 family peptidase [Virgibacillus ihumii]